MNKGIANLSRVERDCELYKSCQYRSIDNLSECIQRLAFALGIIKSSIRWLLKTSPKLDVHDLDGHSSFWTCTFKTH